MEICERGRYSRQIKCLGFEKQQRLLEARVLIIGAGGLGLPAALYLAGAGLAELGIADYDRIDITNLHRQVAYTSAQLGSSKAETLVTRLQELNPDIKYKVFDSKVNASNVEESIVDYDLIIDGSDNFNTRYLLVDACHLNSKPLISGSIYASRGQISFYQPGLACYRCVFPHQPSAEEIPNCNDNGVIGSLAGTIGTMMASEAIKFLAGLGTELKNQLLLYDFDQQSISKVDLVRDSNCPLCGEHPSITKVIQEELKPDQLDGEDLLIDVRTRSEYEAGHLDSALNIPLDEIETCDLEKSSSLVLYCSKGIRSRKAQALLQKLGYNKVRLLDTAS